MKRLNIVLFLFLVLIFFPESCFSQTNQVSLTTYYPAPFGAYDRIRLVPRDDLGSDCTGFQGGIYVPRNGSFANNLLYCDSSSKWGPITGVFVFKSQAAPFNSEIPGIAVDQYVPAKSYDITAEAPYLGIGTNDPKRPLHVSVFSPNVVNAVALDNINHANNNGVSISFRGTAMDAGGFGGSIPFNEFGKISLIKEYAFQTTFISRLTFSVSDGTTMWNTLNLHSDFGGQVGIGKTAPDARLDILASTSGKPYLTMDSDNNTANAGDIFIVTSTGNVGIGIKNPGTYKLRVEGDAYFYSETLKPSDSRLKENITPIAHALDKISQINGVSYEWKDKAHDARKHIGVIAQDVEKVFPELVREDQGEKSVSYDSLIGPLIEAVKELKNQNENLRSHISQQDKRIAEQQTTIKSLERSLNKLERQVE